MPTKVMLMQTGEDSQGTSAVYELAEGFDRVMDLVIPLETAQSALGTREKLTFNLSSGGRVFIRPEAVTTIEEL